MSDTSVQTGEIVEPAAAPSRLGDADLVRSVAISSAELWHEILQRLSQVQQSQIILARSIEELGTIVRDAVIQAPAAMADHELSGTPGALPEPSAKGVPIDGAGADQARTVQGWSAASDTPSLDATTFDARTPDAAGFDTTTFDSPAPDTASLDAAGFDTAESADGIEQPGTVDPHAVLRRRIRGLRPRSGGGGHRFEVVAADVLGPSDEIEQAPWLRIVGRTEAHDVMAELVGTAASATQEESASSPEASYPDVAGAENIGAPAAPAWDTPPPPPPLSDAPAWDTPPPPPAPAAAWDTGSSFLDRWSIDAPAAWDTPPPPPLSDAPAWDTPPPPPPPAAAWDTPPPPPPPPAAAAAWDTPPPPPTVHHDLMADVLGDTSTVPEGIPEPLFYVPPLTVTPAPPTVLLGAPPAPPSLVDVAPPPPPAHLVDIVNSPPSLLGNPPPPPPPPPAHLVDIASPPPSLLGSPPPPSDFTPTMAGEILAADLRPDEGMAPAEPAAVPVTEDVTIVGRSTKRWLRLR